MAEREKDKTNEQKFLPEIRRGRIKELTIHEISDTELETLAHGSPSSVLLNIAIFLLTVAVSFNIALCKADIPAGRLALFFLVVTISGYSAGVLLLGFWIKEYKSVRSVVQMIRKRLPPKGDARIAAEAKVLPENQLLRFNLISASYGTEECKIDVTDKLAAMVTDKGLTVTSSNEIAGDPHYGVPKKLVIHYRSYDRLYEAEVPEGNTATLPHTD